MADCISASKNIHDIYEGIDFLSHHEASSYFDIEMGVRYNTALAQTDNFNFREKKFGKLSTIRFRSCRLSRIENSNVTFNFSTF